MKTLRLAEIKWYCNYCKNSIVQVFPENPPPYCPRCDGRHENEDIEVLAWNIANLVFADKLRKDAGGKYSGKTEKGVKKLRTMRKKDKRG